MKEQAGETADDLQISKNWLTSWCKEYRVSLRYPNKRFSINQDDRKKRIIQFLKNVWTARYWWLKKYKVDPPIISADQMPLHRNESSGQKSLNFSACFIKKNNHLSRERCTVMTIVTSSKKRSAPPVEFVFKGAGKRVTVSPPEKIQVQWAEKGSYRLQNMLTFIERLPTIPTA